MLSRLVFNSRALLRSSPLMTKHLTRTMALSAEDREMLFLPASVPQLVDPADGGEEAKRFDPKKQSLEEFLNIRFGPEMATINDDKNPSRDVKNFPRIGTPIWPERTRMYLIPNSWFELFYEKTGVTGPYVFGATFGTFLLSKEIYIVDHEIFTGISLAILTAVVCVKAGPALRNWYCTLMDEEVEHWDNWQNGMKQWLNQLIQSEVEAQENAKQHKILFDAKRENIKLQLEAEFRRRQMVAYNEVRNRLEYLLAKQTAERQFQQQHMVNWIIDNVAKSISAQGEKDVLQKCLTDLKQLSAKHQISLT